MARLRPLARTHTQLRLLTYKLAETPALQKLRAAQAGLPGLYSHEAFNDIWVQQGSALTNKLNAAISDLGVAHTPADLAELVAATFKTPELAPVTAAAARLYNLQFCLESLRPAAHAAGDVAAGGVAVRPDVSALLQTPTTATQFANEPAAGALREWIEDSFGSVAEFRTLWLNSAHAVRGDGVTWLVAEASYAESALRAGAHGSVAFSRLAVVNTYNAGVVDDAVRLGQLLKLKQQQAARGAAAARRQQERSEIDGAAAAAPAVAAEAGAETAGHTMPGQADRDTVLGSVEEAEEAALFLDRKLVPLLAVDASMRAYLKDYGVFGKRAYLDNVWACVDWDVVADRAPQRFKPSVGFDQ